MTELTEKTIIRRQHDKDNPYFMMARETAQNRVLSYESIGLLAYLLSRPDDWKVIVSDLQREGCGRDKTLRILKELTDAGHLYRETGRDDKGHFFYGDYVVSERPVTEKPYTAEPLTGEPYTANPPLHNRDIQKTDKQKTDKRVTRVPKEFDDVPKQDRLELIKAWADNLPIHPVNVYNREAYHAAAADLYRAGYRAPQVALFVKAKMQDDFWMGKTLSLAKVGELMPMWLLERAKERNKPAPASPAKPKSTVPEVPAFDPQTFTRRAIAEGRYDPAKPPIIGIKANA